MAYEYQPMKNTSSLYLIQKDNLSLKKELLKIIESAEDVIKICSFLITDQELFEAILNKAKNSTCSIFILTHLSEDRLNLRDLDELTEEDKKEIDPHFNNICELHRNGVFIRAARNLHAKFVTIDRNKGFITSANLTSPSLLFNTESGFYLDRIATEKLDHLFDVIYQKGANYIEFKIASNNSDIVYVTEIEDKVKNNYLPKPDESALRFTYNDLDNSLLKEIINILDSAKEYVYISTYSIVQLEKLPDFIQAIERCLLRQVSINVFCRGMNYRSDHLLGSKLLNDYGCRLYGDFYNHSKGIINEKKGMIFTANLDGKHGLTSGFEIGYILDEQQRKEFETLHIRLINQAFYIFKKSFSFSELFKSYDMYEKEKNINNPFGYKIKEIIIPQKHSSLKELIISNIAFIKIKDNQCFISCGNKLYSCTIQDSRCYIEQEKKPGQESKYQSYIFKFNQLKISYL
ncbi:hypothetical protein MPR_1360 [Myroides profundi]|nr:hypothetical protein MPR_1360 [Myroides profundi]